MTVMKHEAGGPDAWLDGFLKKFTVHCNFTANYKK